MRSLLVVPLILFAAPTPAEAGRGKPCDSCAQCTEMLAQPGVEIALSGPIEATGETCVVIRGVGSDFDGGRHAIKGAKVAVQVAADNAVVEHVRVEGGDVGVEIGAVGATLLDVKTTDAKIGVDVKAGEPRIVRSSFTGGQVGVAFGRTRAGACVKGATITSPGAVLQKVEISGARVGVAACEAVPSIVDSTLTGNRIGLLQGEAGPPPNVRGPAARGAWDPCVCAPTLPGMKAETTLFYSSGCSASEFHAGFLPDVRDRGHSIAERRPGREYRAETEVFDAYVRRCAPEISDAIGIPGCMPNYACPASGAVFKIRDDNDRLGREANLNDADDVAEFAAACVSVAAAHFDGDACLVHAIRGSTLCGNGVDIQSARAIPGVDNKCASVKGAGDGTGCGSCDGVEVPAAAPTPAPPTRPAAPKPVPRQATPPKPAAAPSPAAAATPTETPKAPAEPATPRADAPATASTPEPAPGPRVPMWVIIGIIGVAGAGFAGFARRKG